MPVYEYLCGNCAEVIEHQQKITDAPLKACPECGNKVEKLISMSTFVLGGSGWYKDGYGKKDH